MRSSILRMRVQVSHPYSKIDKNKESQNLRLSASEMELDFQTWQYRQTVFPDNIVARNCSKPELNDIVGHAV